jgi:hypothetical protein
VFAERNWLSPPSIHPKCPDSVREMAVFASPSPAAVPTWNRVAFEDTFAALNHMDTACGWSPSIAKSPVDIVTFEVERDVNDQAFPEKLSLLSVSACPSPEKSVGVEPLSPSMYNFTPVVSGRLNWDVIFVSTDVSGSEVSS